MPIQYSMDNDGELLRVKAAGEDENLQEVMQYGLAIIDAAVKSQCRKVLCNEVDLTYKLNTIDIFESAEFIASQAPGVARIAIVCNEKQVSDAKFWEDVAVNRGLQVRVFKDLENAETWLQKHPGAS